MKFMRRKNKKRTTPLGRRRKKMFRIKAILLSVVVVVIIGIFGWLLRLPEVTISNVAVVGNSFISKEQIKSIADKHLNGLYLYVVPKNSEFFLPKRAIEREVEEEFTRIEKAEATLRGGDTLQIKIVERSPHALWCGYFYVDTEKEFGNCYFIDEASYVFAKSPDFTGNIFFKYFGTLLGDTAESSTTPLGKTFMETTEFDGVEVFLETFKEVEYIPVSLTKTPDEDFLIHMKSGVEILYGRDTGLSVVLDNLQSVVQSEAFKSVKQEEIEYIDLRFGSKVYYKLLGEEAIER